jgi:hypothetical protein
MNDKSKKLNSGNTPLLISSGVTLRPMHLKLRKAHQSIMHWCGEQQPNFHKRAFDLLAKGQEK